MAFKAINNMASPVRGEGYEPVYKSRANVETHPRLGWEVVVFQEGGEKLCTGLSQVPQLLL